MATDVQDWTSSVVVQSGTVSISGTATVQISGTPAVTISGTPTVNLAAGTQVTISGTPTVNLAAGSTVTITGTTTITGSVSITGTPAVTISGTPSVNIASGSVNITNAQIAVVNSGSTSLATVQPQVYLGQLAAGVQSNFNLPAGCHSLGIGLQNGVPSRLTVTGLSGTRYLDIPISNNFTVPRFIVIPVGDVSGAETQVGITMNGGASAYVVAILDTAATRVSNTPETPVYTLPATPQLVGFNLSLASGAVSQLLPARTSIPDRLMGAMVELDTTGPASIEQAGAFFWLGLAAGPHPIEFYGVEVALNAAVVIKNYNAGVLNLRGNLIYIPGI